MDDPHLRPAANALAMNDEDFSSYLKRRERELIQQTAAIRGMLIPKEKQLEQIRQAMQAIGIQPSYTEQLKPFMDQTQVDLDQVVASALGNTPLPLLAEALTIKEMILRALKDHFHGGATPSELRDYMRTAYGRDVDRNSISPQLARLRDEGIVKNANTSKEGGKWQLALGVSAEDLVAIGHWPPGAKHHPPSENALLSTPRQKLWYGDGPKED